MTSHPNAPANTIIPPGDPSSSRAAVLFSLRSYTFSDSQVRSDGHHPFFLYRVVSLTVASRSDLICCFVGDLQGCVTFVMAGKQIAPFPLLLILIGCFASRSYASDTVSPTIRISCWFLFLYLVSSCLVNDNGGSLWFSVILRIIR